MGYEATGKLYRIEDAVQRTETFRNRKFVVELNPGEKYSDPVEFEVFGDRCDLLDQFHAGQMVHLDFSIGGREWVRDDGEPRYFNTLKVWKIDADGGGAPDVADEDVPF